MWRALFSFALAAGDNLAIYWLARTLTSVRPSHTQRWCFLAVTPLVQIILAAPLVGGQWQQLVASAVSAMALVGLLGVRWKAGAALAVVASLIHAASFALASYLPPVGASLTTGLPGLGRDLLICLTGWGLTVMLLLISRWLNRTAGHQLDIQAVRSLPWPLLAIFGLSLYNFLAMQQSSMTTESVEVSQVTSLALAAIGLWLFFSSYRSLSQSKENQELKFYLQTIETLTLELRQFRHNYRNILHGLSGYIENQEWDELPAYFRDVVRETEQAELHSYALALKNVTNYALFGLLSEKLQYAKQLGVEMDLNVLGIFGQTGMSATDLCQVVGIFLDNAIEAAQEATTRKIVVTLRFDGSYQQIVISNACARMPALSKANTGGYSSKGSGRGSGLYFAKRLLEKYEHVLHNTIYADGEFSQELVIPVELESK